jgi:hypothetical protein
LGGDLLVVIDAVEDAGGEVQGVVKQVALQANTSTPASTAT